MLTHIAPLLALTVLTTLAGYAAAVDIRTMRIPDAVNLAIASSGIIVSFTLEVIEPITAVAGAVVGGGSLLAVRGLFHSWRGYDGLGLGDVKFAAAAAMWTGVEGLFVMLLVSCVIALATIGAGCVWTGQRLNTRQAIPFGPFLALGAVIVGGGQILLGMTVLSILEVLIPPDT